uniref:Probable G-protein coupled receptor 173 n=1 Tax=Lates calcarifer TaxID=8187 RepID=A0A4W6DUS9_LATCA
MANQSFAIDGPGSLLAVLASQSGLARGGSSSSSSSSDGSSNSGGVSATDMSAYFKLVFLGLIICVSLVGNLLVSLLVLRDRTLHKAPYFFLLDLCLADAVRSAACFPFVLVSVHNSSAWTYSALSCKVVAFMAVLFCFHAAFMLFCVAVTRYLAIAHHRFYAKRMTIWTCAAIICMVWTLAVAMAFPPVFDVGTYKFIRDEDQCIFEHRYLKTNDTLGFMLMLAVVVLATHGFYAKLLLFEYRHRKMKPVQLVPAISQNWTFHGPGATGQAAANWIAGFRSWSHATHSVGHQAKSTQSTPAAARDGRGEVRKEAGQDVLHHHPALPGPLGSLHRGVLLEGVRQVLHHPSQVPLHHSVDELRPGWSQPHLLSPAQRGPEESAESSPAHLLED